MQQPGTEAQAATDLAVVGARRRGEHLAAEAPDVVELHDALVVVAPPLLRLPLVVHLAAARIAADRSRTVS